MTAGPNGWPYFGPHGSARPFIPGRVTLNVKVVEHETPGARYSWCQIGMVFDISWAPGPLGREAWFSSSGLQLADHLSQSLNISEVEIAMHYSLSLDIRVLDAHVYCR